MKVNISEIVFPWRSGSTTSSTVVVFRSLLKLFYIAEVILNKTVLYDNNKLNTHTLLGLTV